MAYKCTHTSVLPSGNVIISCPFSSLERNQARKLLNTTYQTLSHLSPSTSTPIKPKVSDYVCLSHLILLFFTQEAGLSPPGDDLLHSIRSELDRSISKHMDSGTHIHMYWSHDTGTSHRIAIV